MIDLVSPSDVARKTLMERLEDALLPLINLVFLLLMFFITAGQLQNHALPKLPGTANDNNRSQAEADLVVQSNGQWRARGQNADSDNLASLLPSADASPSLTIGAAAETSMADLEALFALLSDHGYDNVVLLTEPSGQ